MGAVFSESKRFLYSESKFYGKQKTDKGEKWRQLECYLPSVYATGTYGEPIQATGDRWLNEFDNGTRKASFIGGGVVVGLNGSISRIKKEKPAPITGLAPDYSDTNGSKYHGD